MCACVEQGWVSQGFFFNTADQYLWMLLLCYDASAIIWCRNYMSALRRMFRCYFTFIVASLIIHLSWSLTVNSSGMEFCIRLTTFILSPTCFFSVPASGGNLGNYWGSLFFVVCFLSNCKCSWLCDGSLWWRLGYFLTFFFFNKAEKEFFNWLIEIALFEKLHLISSPAQSCVYPKHLRNRWENRQERFCRRLAEL